MKTGDKKNRGLWEGTRNRGGYKKLNVSVTDQSGSKGGEGGVQSGLGLDAR